MGIDNEPDIKRDSTLGLSPNTVLPPSRHCSSVRKRSAKVKLGERGNFLTLKDDFRQISFGRYRSASCKSIQSKPFGLEGNIALRRGSVYQSSREVMNTKKMAIPEGREKIEMSDGSDTPLLSFRIVDSLSNSDEEQKRSSVTSMNSNATSISTPYMEMSSPKGFLEICFNSDNRAKCDSAMVDREVVEELKLKFDQVVSPLNGGNGIREQDEILAFNKSLSAKVEIPQCPSPSQSDHSPRAGVKARFRPIRKMFDPFMKSKSLRNPSGYVVEPSEVKTTGTGNMRSNKTLRKSLLPDFSNTAYSVKDNKHSIVSCSPIHLHGCLKLKNRNGTPIFEFSSNFPEDVIIAKTWKADTGFNWVYTFHSIDNRKGSNANGWGSNNGNKESSMLGQMQVSCYICSDVQDGRAFDNSMVTEFLLYDIAHAKKSIADHENSCSSADVNKSPKGSSVGLVGGTLELNSKSDAARVKLQTKKHGIEQGDMDSLNLYPWSPADLHADLEIGAIVIHVPFQKRESLKHKCEDSTNNKAHQNLLDLSIVEQQREKLCDNASPVKMKVAIPSGNHGLPSAESQGPSSLLDRWKQGGGCDCGGWDMACPLIVFESPCLQCADQIIMENHQPLELFAQGPKENTPALTLTFVEKGEYAVDFHARFSTLQAFSICMAILHSANASSCTGQEKEKQLSHSGSLKMLTEDGVKFLIEAVREDEKGKVTKPRKELAQSFLINPPFSPIARV